MALSSIALASRALLKIGAQPISGFDEGTAESLVAAALYPSTRDALLSAHPWSFATAQRRLPRLAAAPAADYDHAISFRAISCGRCPRARPARGGGWNKIGRASGRGRG